MPGAEVVLKTLGRRPIIKKIEIPRCRPLGTRGARYWKAALRDTTCGDCASPNRLQQHARMNSRIDALFRCIRDPLRAGTCHLLGALACALILHTAAAPVSAQTGIGSYAVVVGPSSAIVQLSLDQLRRLYLAESTTLPSGERARIVVLKPFAAAFDQMALGLSEARVRRRWVSAAFRGEVTVIPTEVETAADVRRELATYPNAVGFLPFTALDASVRVVRIEGKHPSDPKYPIR